MQKNWLMSKGNYPTVLAMPHGGSCAADCRPTPVRPAACVVIAGGLGVWSSSFGGSRLHVGRQGTSELSTPPNRRNKPHPLDERERALGRCGVASVGPT